MSLINLKMPELDETYKKLIKDLIMFFIYTVFITSVYLTMNIKEIHIKELIFLTLLMILFHRLIGENIIKIF